MNNAGNDSVILELKSGPVVIALRPDLAPNHTARIKELSERGFYDGASFHFLSMLAPYGELKKSGLGWADVRQLIEYKREIPSGSLLVVRTTLSRLGNKSVEYLHELRNVETDALHSTSEQVTVLFDLNKRAAARLDEAIRRRAAALGLPG